jgi:hypothetical protein
MRIIAFPPNLGKSANLSSVTSDKLIQENNGGSADDTDIGILTVNTLNVFPIIITSGNIYGVNNFNGVVVESHSERHSFGGSDPLTPGLTVDIQPIGLKSEGTSNKIPRADHVHAHGIQMGGTLHADVTTTTSGFMSSSDKLKIDDINASNANPSEIGISYPGIDDDYSRADHVHAHGIQLGGTLHADVTSTTSGFMSSSDKLKIDDINASNANPSEIGISYPGIDDDYSRADHVHAHGIQLGGTLHADATESTSGFMTGSDKIVLNNLSWDNITETLTISTKLTVTNQQFGSIDSNTAQFITSGVETLLNTYWGGTQILRGISYASGVYTIIYPGFYNIIANPITATNTPGIRYAYISINNSNVKTGLSSFSYSNTNIEFRSLHCQYNVFLNTNDTVRIYIFSSTSSFPMSSSIVSQFILCKLF